MIKFSSTKNHLKSLLCFLIICLFLACSDNETLIQLPFVTENSELAIKREVISLEKYEVLDLPNSAGVVSDIAVLDDLMVITDKSGDQVFHLVDLESNEYLDSVIDRGKGPEEISRTYTAVRSLNGLGVFDSEDQSINLFEKKDFINRRIGEKISMIPSGEHLHCVLVSESNIYANTFRSTPLMKLDRTGSFVEDYTALLTKGVLSELPHIFGSQMSYTHIARLDDLIVVTYKYFPIIQILDLNDNSVEHLSISFDKNSIPSRMNQHGIVEYGLVAGKVKRYFSRTYTTPNRVYMLFDGDYYDPTNKDTWGLYGSTILSIDNNLSITQYELPYQVTAFGVDDNDRYLYVHNNQESEGVYWKFALENFDL